MISVTVVVAAHWLPWIRCVCLLCAWHHHQLEDLHPISSIVNELNSKENGFICTPFLGKAARERAKCLNTENKKDLFQPQKANSALHAKV